jgi:hypothetical protein
MLSVDALGDTTPAYGFRVLDVASAAPVSLGTVVNGVMNPATSAALFRFDVPAAGNYFFDNRTLSGTGGSDKHIWRLYDPFGSVVFSSDFAVGTQQIFDAEARLSIPGSYLLLIEPDIRSQAPLAFEFLIRPTSSPETPLTLNATTSESLDAPGDSDRYTFTLATDSFLYFDSLTNEHRLRWSLSGPDGRVKLADLPEEGFSQTFSRTFETSDGARRDPGNDFELLPLRAGDYELTIDGDGDRVGPYQFRLVDARSAVSVTPGTPFSGELAPSNETDLYRFEAIAGDALVFSSNGSFSAGIPIWHVIDPYGQPVTPASGDVFDRLVIGEGFALTAPRTGTYTVLVEGEITGHNGSAYSISVERLASTSLEPPVADSLALDTVETGQIEDRASLLIYSFEGQAGQRVFFDGIQADSGGMTFRLMSPSGEDVFGLLNRPDNRRPGIFLGGAIRRLESLSVANRGPFTLPETGTYQLVVDATEDAAGRPPLAGVIGGAGFRTGALPVVLVATDTGTAFQPAGIDPIVGAGGVTVPLAQFGSKSRASTPQGRGSTIQSAISALNSLGAIVIGMGTNAEANASPRQTLEAVARLTGAVNASNATFANKRHERRPGHHGSDSAVASERVV